MAGTLLNIFVSDVHEAPPHSVQEAELIAGQGVTGDRYAHGKGTFSPETQDPDHELTLIEVEEVRLFNERYGKTFDAGAFRRNLVTQDVRLNDLVGVEFAIGQTVARGIRLCEPCRHLAGLTCAEVVEGMAHRAGLRAAIVRGGVVRVGDAVTTGSA